MICQQIGHHLCLRARHSRHFHQPRQQIGHHLCLRARHSRLFHQHRRHRSPERRSRPQQSLPSGVPSQGLLQVPWSVRLPAVWVPWQLYQLQSPAWASAPRASQQARLPQR